MNRTELASLCICLFFFALGGLVGSMHAMMRMLGLDHPRLPWRAKLRFYHFFGENEDLVARAQQIDREIRELYGAILITVLSDLGGSGPWPRSREAMNGLLAETERRFQSRTSKTGWLQRRP